MSANDSAVEPQQGFIATWGPSNVERQETLDAFATPEPAPDVDLEDAIVGGVHHLVTITPGSVTVYPVDPAECAHCGPKIGWGQDAVGCYDHSGQSMEPRRLLAGESL